MRNTNNALAWSYFGLERGCAKIWGLKCGQLVRRKMKRTAATTQTTTHLLLPCPTSSLSFLPLSLDAQ